MQITDILAQMGGLKSIARELGINEAQVASGADALAPAVLGGFKKQVTEQPTGLAGLGGLLEKLGGGALLDNVLSPEPTNVSAGNDVLGQIFGSKDVSRAVANDASNKSGLDPSLLKKMLPMIAMMVAGYMAKNRGNNNEDAAQTTSGGGGLGGLLGGLLGGSSGSNSGLGGLGGLASMLDANGDGNPLDDIMKKLR